MEVISLFTRASWFIFPGFRGSNGVCLGARYECCYVSANDTSFRRLLDLILHLKSTHWGHGTSERLNLTKAIRLLLGSTFWVISDRRRELFQWLVSSDLWKCGIPFSIGSLMEVLYFEVRTRECNTISKSLTSFAGQVFREIRGRLASHRASALLLCKCALCYNDSPATL